MASITGRCLLRNRLAERKMTQVELAEKLELKPQRISDYIYNRRPMSLNVAKSISDVLHCNIEDLYEWHTVPASRLKSRRSKE
ncbi:helix-turn-helix transcriptional regulator [Aneurinibacillus aneurinilyticus]|uniref:helix-turn-helix domain-containing protein n=1 Tax=Aneurinibacillus aneurinilyticus TaxID=1391 RepID=UPI002E22B581|nr:helix-turn-helix transcriptional regulator [Aneurinibacillus aneurinilyticus]MED0726513.1 helix-turn-helix transcriptional regulator [Aneurinibacillus aneurinilyticus]